MKRFLLVVLCFLTFPLAASHIVGGEFEIQYISGTSYRINLILYFDELNGLSGARDPNVSARIYRKRDNAVIQSVVFLDKVSETPVSYTQPACSRGEIVTTKLVYSNVFNMPASMYDDPDGYYIVWERCCRNYTITNVVSNDPQFGQYAGQTFYLEFPPVVKNGVPFINSTPRLFPPLNDFACPNRPYYVDFAGTDDDGDSLVYSLVTPLNTKSGDAVPEFGPRPRPYPDVVWRAPFNFANVMNGNPDLKVNQDGFITVTPTRQGLFVFAVKCEEYRAGIKIGEVRRDFQMLVVDRCPQAEPPQILGKKLSDDSFSYDNTMSVSFTNAATDEDRCIQVQVSDPDASKQDDNFQERVNIKVIPIGFKANVSGILPSITTGTLINGDTKVFDICFPECPFLPGPFQVGIVAYDDACSLPLFDTLKVTVNIQPPPNSSPYFTTPDVTAVLTEGQSQTWSIQAKDNDGDPLVLGVVPIGFTMQSAGMTLTTVSQENGLINAELKWDAFCDIYDFTQRTEFEVMVVAEDLDQCLMSTPDVMRLKLKVNVPGNNKPVIDSDLTDDPTERVIGGIKKQTYESLTFNVNGKDGDNDLLLLDVKGVGFDVNNYDITFEPASANGFVNSQFTWNINCDVDLAEKDVYNFQFIVVDNANRCKYYLADTLDVLVEVEPPNNSPPVISVLSLNAKHQLIDNSMTTMLGEQINLGLYGTDSDHIPDQDFLRLELIEAKGTVPPEGYVFAPAEGKGNVETTFSWNPECNIFQNGVYENEYQFAFRVYDSRCNNVMGDSLEVNIVIRDIESETLTFNPSNFISPNGDNCNDYFALEGIDPGDPNNGGCYNPEPDAIVSLPKDNCQRHFEMVTIYNRWGGMVYESNSRDFRWYAPDEPNGVYYYTLKFSDKEYKGTVTVRY